MEETKFRSLSIEGFLDALGSTSHIPGGGAAAAQLGATACALAEKTARITLSNKNYADVHEEAKRWVSVFPEARDILLDLMDEDAKQFQNLMESYKNFKKQGMSEAEAEEAKPEEEIKQAEAEEEPAAKEGGKKVVIDEVVVSGGSVHLSAKLMQGTALPIPLPTITLNDIGKAEIGRASCRERV